MTSYYVTGFKTSDGSILDAFTIPTSCATLSGETVTFTGSKYLDESNYKKAENRDSAPSLCNSFDAKSLTVPAGGKFAAGELGDDSGHVVELVVEDGAGGSSFSVSGLTSLQKIVFQGTVKSVAANDTKQKYFAYELPHLKTVIANKNTVLATKMFNKCASLSNVTLNGCTVGSNAFLETGLKAIDISDATLNDNAFAGTAIEEIISMKNAVIGKGAFQNCTSLTKLGDAEGVSLGASCFSGCTSITEFTFDNIKSLGSAVFSGSGLSGNVKTITLGKIDGFADSSVSPFIGIEGLEEITATQQCAAIPGAFFKGCNSLKKVTINTDVVDGAIFQGLTQDLDIVFGTNCHWLSGTMFYLVGEGFKPSFTTYSTDLTLTDEGILYNSVGQQLWPYDPKNGEYQQSRAVVIVSERLSDFFKDGILHVYNDTVGCQTHFNSIAKSLIGFNVASDNSHFKVQDGALYSFDGAILYRVLPNATSFKVADGVKTIFQTAFSYCDALESVSLPDSLREIGYGAFYGCSALKAIKIPDSVEHISFGAFAGTQISSLKLGGRLWTTVSIDSGLFTEDGASEVANTLFYYRHAASYSNEYDNTVLTVLDLSGYQSSYIPHYAFSGLGGLTEVVIPASVQTIGSGAFYECQNLRDVYIYTPTAIKIAFAGGGSGGSGVNANEVYAISEPGSFAWWNPEIAGIGYTGNRYDDLTGLTFYGAAYNDNALLQYCKACSDTFVPVVTLQTLSAQSNPFGSYVLSYGDTNVDYGYIDIVSIAVGGTPQVLAKFGSYDGVRDLTNDAACSITYYDADDNVVTSFDKDGVYKAKLKGDGKSVFGENEIEFVVGKGAVKDDGESGKPAGENADTEIAGSSSNAGATAGTSPATANTVYQVVYSAAPVAAQSSQTLPAVFAVDNATGIVSALERIAGTDGSVLVWGGSNAASPQYVWEVVGTRLTAASIATLDFSVADASKDAAVTGLVGDADFTAFTVKQAGSFPATYKLHWKTSSTFYDGAKVDVYRVVAASGATGSASESAFVEKAYAADGDKSLELLKSGVVATDGYVTVDVDRGGTYVLVESGADVGLPLVEKAYADTGEIVAADVDEGAQQASNWMMPTAVAAVIAAVVGACGGWFARGRRQDASTEQTSGQKR